MPSLGSQPSPRLRSTVQLAVVGDIHHQWDDHDRLALQHLGIDIVLFVGDFGNEAVELVRTIATLDLPMASAFGNHDAWYTATPWGRSRCPYDRTTEDWVKMQLALLDGIDVGYGARDFNPWQLSVVGGRPFSWGGPDWRYAEFYQEWYGVDNFAESQARIIQAAASTNHPTVIFLGHNGPAGLGDQPEAPCGRDWKPLGGDFGDPDLEGAIAATKRMGKTVPLVAFGHMHHTLRHTQIVQRTRLCVDADGTVYLNAACVPRIHTTASGQSRNFSLVTLQDQKVSKVQLVWINQDLEITSAEILYCQPSGTLKQPLGGGLAEPSPT